MVDRLILVTDQARDYYKNKYGIASEKITVLPNYISLDRFRMFEPDSKFKSELTAKFTVVYFGDTGLRRGTLTILESAEILKRSNIHFLIIGTSREHNLLRKTADDLKLQNVTFTGWGTSCRSNKVYKHFKSWFVPFFKKYSP